ncbi:MAG: reverse transcriptase family protein [Reichenbachiella sp.]|uniref:reverse transcriptase family protein n=1 Tax=Reichenbachiella sp. TaxID=2184521 RepID=UPI0029667F82|nr:reverse transcriptase family protein [Reichenbachiella sp.]MDW3209202.1 reverse transcriptase family protein [Reichenbachiella sp.]
MIRSKKHLERVLKCSFAELEKLAGQSEGFYYEKKELKRVNNRGKEFFREMYPSIGMLKKMQAIIKGAVLRKIPLNDCVYGGVKGKDSVLNAKAHQGRKYKFCTDLKNFFPSITSTMVYCSFIDHGFSSDIARILTKLTTYKHKVPQGTPTSAHIANMVFTGIDKKLISLCEGKDIKYTRYVDDLTFSSPNSFKEETQTILEIIKAHDFRISNRKTKYVKGSLEITGARVRNNVLSPTDKFKKKLNHPDKYEQNQVKGHQTYYKRLKSVKIK